MDDVVIPHADGPFPDGMVEEIAAVLANDAIIPDGQDLYPHIFEASLFMPLQRKKEMRQMMAAARRVPHATIMEVGTDRAGGVYHWCKGLQPHRMIACEIRGTPYAPAFELAFPKIDFCWQFASSYDASTVRAIRKWLSSDLIDVLFLDGDKNMFHADFEAYLPLMSPGGTIFMHDIRVHEPGQAFARAILHPRVVRSEKIIDVSEYQELVDLNTRGARPAGAYEDWLWYWVGQSCGVGVLKLDAL
jgi:predicted O-methyltransferase YrrM